MKPKTQNRRLEPTGLAKPGETRGLTGTGLGLARQQSAGRVFGRVWKQTDLFLWSKPGPLAGYPDPLLTLVTTSLPHQKSMILWKNHHITATNIDQSVYCLVRKICSSARCIFSPSPIFDMFKCEQAVAQKPSFWATMAIISKQLAQFWRYQKSETTKRCAVQSCIFHIPNIELCDVYSWTLFREPFGTNQDRTGWGRVFLELQYWK